MFRKIHSNRDSKATFYSELKREFGGYFNTANERSLRVLQAYPKPAFWGMLLLLLLSAGLSFTVFRHPATSQKATVSTPASQRKPTLNDGFDHILSTGAALRQTLHLKSEVEVLLCKGKLNHADSLALENALDSLGQLHHQINHVP